MLCKTTYVTLLLLFPQRTHLNPTFRRHLLLRSLIVRETVALTHHTRNIGTKQNLDSKDTKNSTVCSSYNYYLGYQIKENEVVKAENRK